MQDAKPADEAELILPQHTNYSRSIGDVVQGLHGGKSQLPQPSSSSSVFVSFEGQRFAERGYSSGVYEGDQYDKDDNENDDEDDALLPVWALKLQQVPPPGRSYSQLDLSSSSSSFTAVQIQNEERSWGPFYAFIVINVGNVVGHEFTITSTLSIRPSKGMLAPRGHDGTTTRFFDSAMLQITGSVPTDLAGDVWVIVGTEAETWTYQLI